MKKIEVNVIPAPTGWHVISPLVHENEVIGVVYTPIVGWKIISEGLEDRLPEAIPITLETVEDNPVLRSPDERYFIPEDRSFGELSDVVAYFKKERETKRK